MKMPGMGSGQKFWTLLSPAERDALSNLGVAQDYPAGETICHQGDPAVNVFILVTGWVKIVSYTDGGRESVLALRGDGEIVGETGPETTGQRNATIKAIDDVHALIVRYDRFNSFLDSNPRAGRAYRHMVMVRWKDADMMLRIRPITTGAQRLARLLLDLADLHGRVVNGAVHLEMPLTQDELASLAGTSRPTVTRAFRSWRNRGFIRTGQRHIAILDQAALAKIAGQQTDGG
jgi:CRP/FNR family transcriptional regulator, cyclic AMP receptor protein